MRPDLEDLISRMTYPAKGLSSEDSLSWAAYREAEKLDDPSLLADLLQAIGRERSKQRRQAYYFIIGKIGQNRQDVGCVEALLGLLASETDKHNLSALLQGIARIRKPAALDLSPVYALLGERRWLVRHAAIQALANSESPGTETRLLQHLAATEEPDDQVYCNAVLNQLGTTQSIPALTAQLTSRKRDVRMSAEFALCAIRAREPT